MSLITSRYALLSSLLAVTILSSCTTSSDQAQVSEAVATVMETPPSVWASLADNNEVPNKWLESFNDPLLLSLIDEGRANNYNLQVALGNMNRSALLAEQAGVALQPSVNLSAGGAQAGNFDNSNTQDNLNLGLQLSWELDVWGRIRSGINSAEAELQAAQADYIFAQHSLSANIARSYFLVIESNQQLEISNSNLELLRETLRIVNVQFENNVVSAQEVALARANFSSAQENLLRVEGSLRDSQRSLEVLLGRYPEAELELSNTFPILPSMPGAGIPSDILERRPDIIAAERRVASAFSLIDQAKAARLPSIGLTTNISAASNELSTLLDPLNVAWQAGASLLAPIFDGGAGRIQVEIATVAQEQALASYAQAALTAFAEVEQNLDQGLVLAARENELAIVQQEFTEAYRLTNLRYLEGESALLDVLQIQQQANSANINLLSIQRSQLEQRINLYLSLGGSW